MGFYESEKGPSASPQDNIPPTVTIKSPANGAVYPRRSNLTVAAVAADNLRLNKLEFFQNNQLFCTDKTAPYSCSLKLPNTVNTSIILSVKAYDSSGNSAVSNPVTIKTK